MLHILTIAVRQIIYAFALSVENSQILIDVKEHYLSKKEEISGNLVIFLGFQRLLFWKKNL